MARVLYVATSDIHLNTFHRPYLEWLAAQGHSIDIAVENRSDHRFDSVSRSFSVTFPRTVWTWKHLIALRELRRIIDAGRYDLLHCHTPIPSALTRFAARRFRQRGGKVLYTAHGFHFHRGGPVRNWLTYFPVEYLLASNTDGVVTINREDLLHARRMPFNRSYLIPGVGVDNARFRPVSLAERTRIRRSLGLDGDAFILFYVAEFIPRKNHKFIVSTGQLLQARIPNLRILFVGTGRLFGAVQKQIARQNLDGLIECLGFREDVPRLAAIADVGISSSRREGLGLGVAEQMMCAVPVVVSSDKGHAELVEHGVNGFLYPQGDANKFVDYIDRLYTGEDLRAVMGRAAQLKAEQFSVEHSLAAMARIYNELLGK